MTKEEIKKELESKLKQLCQLSDKEGLSVEECLSIIREIDNLSKTIALIFS